MQCEIGTGIRRASDDLIRARNRCLPTHMSCIHASFGKSHLPSPRGRQFPIDEAGRPPVPIFPYIPIIWLVARPCKVATRVSRTRGLAAAALLMENDASAHTPSRCPPHRARHSRNVSHWPTLPSHLYPSLSTVHRGGKWEGRDPLYFYGCLSVFLGGGNECNISRVSS